MDGLARGAVAAHAALQVPPVACEPGIQDLRVVQEQGHPAVAGPVRCQQLELVGELKAELVAGHKSIDLARAYEVVGCERGGGASHEGSTKRRDVLGAQAQPAGDTVPAERDEVLGVAGTLVAGFSVMPLQPAESGLALMQWRDSVLHQAFFLGEVPISRAAIALVDAQERRFEGGAVVMADDADLAYALAVLDAVWAHRLPGAELVDSLAASGESARARIRAERQAMLKRTRVDFSLLSQADDEDAP